ncbi:hypothetical protein TREMEDRAFT_58826 [Tremella mesenterica DSM 1558]|uniref:uncharacterized protein n=1 Tax=Tremella mesenterica (strain ATCC 24925 / CBS 8224 / DSM 1558 / NBRC 9311 / NRRL Y-6157 / RJB 2259-6 / UBC 559-6) TaxID=578456 RepID=UPI0003F49345|nr:uncharacterized protein TREMEDRAFT_58826 [Tremella mesenterica DSM 1558]EIW72659.1 hypothetical protein TREMEDRAFT_58826 [Tremella mesenterica DSM 1558]
MKDSALLAALADCHKSTPPNRPNFSEIARQHQINRRTLQRNYDSSLQPQLVSVDHRALLTEAQEQVLLEHVESLGKRHLYPTPAILRNMAAEIINHRPSASWASKFIKKHEGRVKCMVIGGMEASRHAAEYRPAFEDYFDQLESRCDDLNIGPTAIYNMDEKGFMMGRPNKQHRVVPVEEANREGGPLSRVDGSREWPLSVTNYVVTPRLLHQQ